MLKTHMSAARTVVERRAILASTIFFVGALFSYVRVPNGQNVYIHVGDLAIACLAGLCLIAQNGEKTPRRGAAIALVAAASGFILAAYSFAWPFIRDQSNDAPSLKLGAAACTYVCVSFAFAKTLFNEQAFITAFRITTLAATLTGIVAYFLNALLGSEWLVHLQYGTPRLQGFLSEPSSWAPFLSGLMLVSLRQRRYMSVAVAALAALLTKSPSVVVVLGLTLPAYVVVSTRRNPVRLAMAFLLVVGGLLSVSWLRSARIQSIELAPTIYDQIVVKLAEGVRNVLSGGSVGRNDRFAITLAVYRELQSHGWLAFGIGPGSEGYLRQAIGSVPNSLATFVLASFGLCGLAVLVGLLIRTSICLRKRPSLVVFLPFIVASLFNSAGGWESYKVVVVGIAVCGAAYSTIGRQPDHSDTQETTSSEVRQIPGTSIACKGLARA